jgi:hypothetical protein
MALNVGAGPALEGGVEGRLREVLLYPETALPSPAASQMWGVVPRFVQALLPQTTLLPPPRSGMSTECICISLQCFLEFPRCICYLCIPICNALFYVTNREFECLVVSIATGPPGAAAAGAAA